MVRVDEKKEPLKLGPLVDAAVTIARERQQTLASMRAALEAGNDSDALEWARKLCGLEQHDHKSNRIT